MIIKKRSARNKPGNVKNVNNKENDNVSDAITPSAEGGDYYKYCPCDSYYDEILEIVQCENERCKIWWHLRCLGLEALPDDSLKDVHGWICPYCVSEKFKKCESREIQTDDVDCEAQTLNADINSASTTVDKSDDKPVTIKELKEEIAILYGKLKGDESELKDEIKLAVSEVKITKTWAQVAADEQKGLLDEIKKAREEVKKAKTSGPSKELVSQVVGETAPLLISSGLKKIDSDHAERQKRVCNVIIKRVTESNSDDKETITKLDKNFVTETLKIPAGEIVNLYRAGPLLDKDGKRRFNRPLVVELMDKASADYWHNNGRGRKVEGTELYINQDLCAADRHANFLAREEFRKRQKAKNSPSTSPS